MTGLALALAGCVLGALLLAAAVVIRALDIDHDNLPSA